MEGLKYDSLQTEETKETSIEITWLGWKNKHQSWARQTSRRRTFIKCHCRCNQPWNKLSSFKRGQCRSQILAFLIMDHNAVRKTSKRCQRKV